MLQREHMSAGQGMPFATGHQTQQIKMMRHHHPTFLPSHHCQRDLKRMGPAGSDMRHAAVDADFSVGIKTQTQPFGRRLQSVLYISIQTFWVEGSKQRTTGEIFPCFPDTGELLAAPKSTPGWRQTINKTTALSDPNDGLIEPGRHG